MNGGSSVSYLACTPCVPLFCISFNRGGNRRVSRLAGEGGDHFHCTMEPSSRHIRCQVSAPQRKGGLRLLAWNCSEKPRNLCPRFSKGFPQSEVWAKFPFCHRVLQGAAQRVAQFYFIFAVLRTPFSCNKMSHFYLKTCTPVKGTP